ncbi:MAG TPA: NTP transferase domain-containing protein [Actinomycetota bacterium]|nr:NTP transferase domain-containing protein [Actinomycetota bacterium]
MDLRYPVAVLSGGLGTRMAQRTGPHLPKALLPVAGRPFIDHKLIELRRAGAQRVILLTGHGSDELAAHVGDGAAFGLTAELVPDGDRLLGTGGAIRRALAHLGEVFWVTFGDTLLAVPMLEIEATFDAAGLDGVMTVLENHDRWDVSNVAVAEGKVVEYRKGAPPSSFAFIDYGMSLLRADAFLAYPEGEAFDLSSVLQGLIAAGRLGAAPVGRRFFEIGSESGFADTEAFLRGAS